MARPDPVLARRTLRYVRTLARRSRSPLVAILGSSKATTAFHQYPDPGINWVGDGLGYFYHSHGPASSRQAAHGHFHLFACEPDYRGVTQLDSYSHLLAIEVDATGAPSRLFTTNLWVTCGHWRSAPFVRNALRRFAALATLPGSGPERWIGMMLGLVPAEVHEVLRRREERVGQWRRERIARSRLADRRIHVLSSVPIAMSA